MNSPELMVVLMIGMLLMCCAISLQMKRYETAAWKSIVIVVFLVATGLIGSKLWYYVENGSFMGRSFFGVVFLAPVVFYPVSLLLKLDYGYTLDFCAPAGCLTLALVKLQCLRDGCCVGKVLYQDENYNYVRFPSQIVEMIAFLVIAGILFGMSTNPKYRKKIFPMFLLYYGGSRFALNFLRGENTTYALGLAAGSFWAMWAFILGAAVLLAMRMKETRE